MESISPFPPRPVRYPVMFQRWRWLTFLHWRYDADAIRRLLPPHVTLDTYDGVAWIGLTPFFLTGLRPPFTPALPWISRFPETNVRTYVRGPDGERGIWFFTLEAARLAAVIGARIGYGLPYRWARMRVARDEQHVEYRSVRKRLFGRGETNIAVEPRDEISPGEFDHFLTARFRLYTVRANRLAYAQIEHDPWPLRSARLLHLEQTLIRHLGIPEPSGEPVLHYSADLVVRIGRLRFC